MVALNFVPSYVTVCMCLGPRNPNSVSQVSLKNPNDVKNFPDTQSLLKNDKDHYGNRQLTTAEKRFLVEVN